MICGGHATWVIFTGSLEEDIHRSRCPHFSGGMMSSDMHQVKIRHNHSPASSK